MRSRCKTGRIAPPPKFWILGAAVSASLHRPGKFRTQDWTYGGSYVPNAILIGASCHPCAAKNRKIEQIWNKWEFPYPPLDRSTRNLACNSKPVVCLLFQPNLTLISASNSTCGRETTNLTKILPRVYSAVYTVVVCSSVRLYVRHKPVM